MIKRTILIIAALSLGACSSTTAQKSANALSAFGSGLSGNQYETNQRRQYQESQAQTEQLRQIQFEQQQQQLRADEQRRADAFKAMNPD